LNSLLILKLYLIAMFEKINNFPYFVLFRAMWKHVGIYKRVYTLSLIGLIVAQCIGLLSPFIFGKIIDHVQHGLAGKRALAKGILLCICYFMITPINWLFNAPSRIYERQTGFFVYRNYLEETYSKVRQLPYSWHQNLHSGQLVDRIRKAASALEDFTVTQFIYMRFLVDFFGPLMILIYFFPWAGLACVVMGAIAFITISKFDKYLIPLYGEKNKLSHEEAGMFSDYLSNIRTIITLRLGQITQYELIQRYMAKQNPHWRDIRLTEYKWAAISNFADFFVAILMISILVWVHNGAALALGSIVMLIQYLARFSGLFFNMGAMYQQLVQQATNYSSAQMIEEEFLRHTKQLSYQPPDNAQHWDEMRFTDLRFTYKDKVGRPLALEDLNFTLKRGEKVALVGPSGSGKSTLMSLLRGLYDADSVTLEFGGQIYNNTTILRDMTALIPQDPETFENTIRYNITFGVDRPEEEVMKACRIACFDTVLTGLEQGLETDIREKGVNLSGGQRQRLALARGVFGIEQSQLILLDEPTSSLDTATEGQVFDNLFRNFPDKTMIASVHRLHLLPLFDRVIVMQQGRIVEQGIFGDLVKQEGLLRELWLNYQNFTRHQIEQN
jgi:ABC-type multidrug transport system fused ATPase/permease subunit